MTGQDDRILPFTRVLGGVIVPFLIVASVLLYGFPTRTDELFAWTIAPPLSAMFLACAYIGGIWFFSRVLILRAWHRVKYGFPAVVVFASLASAATFLHWDKFHFGHISFVTWVILYVTTPFLALAATVLNWRRDPRVSEGRDFDVPPIARIVLAALGGLALLCGIVLFAVPTLLVGNWAWDLTPLTARIVGAILTLPGMVNVWMLVDARWTAFRWVFQAQIVSLLFIIGALVLARADLDWSTPAAPILIAGLAGSLAAYVAFYAYCERGLRGRSHHPVE
jgi:hypothetical protein